MEIEIVEVPVQSLSPNPWNPNVQPEHVFAALRRSIRQDGFLVPIVARPIRFDGTPATQEEWESNKDPTQYGWEIIAGEHRWRALVDLGVIDEAVPVVVYPCDDATARRLCVSLNMRGEWDEARLAEALEAIAADLDVQAVYDMVGLDPKLVDKLLGGAAMPEEEPAPEPEAGASAEVWTEMVFALTPDMAEVVRQALDKAKRLAETDSDSAALVHICADFLAQPDEAYR